MVHCSVWYTFLYSCDLTARLRAVLQDELSKMATHAEDLTAKLNTSVPRSDFKAMEAECKIKKQDVERLQSDATVDATEISELKQKFTAAKMESDGLVQRMESMCAMTQVFISIYVCRFVFYACVYISKYACKCICVYEYRYVFVCIYIYVYTYAYV